METLNLKSNFVLKLTTFIVSIVLLLSCDPAIGYRYTINNQSDKELKVFYKFDYHDSLIIIKPKTDIAFFETGMWGKNPHDEKDDFLILDSLRIEASDKSILLLGYLKRQNWTYSCEPSHNGFIETGLNIYKLKINNENFQ
jgi:hypothetical protein